jgi:DNA-binding protein H-NS
MTGSDDSSQRGQVRRAVVATFRELKAQVAALEEQAAAARELEFHDVLAEIKAKVAEYGITSLDIFGGSGGRLKKSRESKLPPRYRDPATGATWSGRGRTPGWIRNVRNRDKFLISDDT